MKIFYLLAVFLLSACVAEDSEIQTTDAMEGRAVNVRAPAYDEMCQRDPNSLLCKVKDDDTN